MYLGALTAFVFFSAAVGRAGLYPKKGVIAVLATGALLWAFDGLNSFAALFANAPHLYEPNNTLRLFTGSMIGVGLMTMIYAPFQQLAWRNWIEQRVILDWKHFGYLALLVAMVDLLVLSFFQSER